MVGATGERGDGAEDVVDEGNRIPRRGERRSRILRRRWPLGQNLAADDDAAELLVLDRLADESGELLRLAHQRMRRRVTADEVDATGEALGPQPAVGVDAGPTVGAELDIEQRDSRSRARGRRARPAPQTIRPQRSVGRSIARRAPPPPRGHRDRHREAGPCRTPEPPEAKHRSQEKSGAGKEIIPRRPRFSEISSPRGELLDSCSDPPPPPLPDGGQSRGRANAGNRGLAAARQGSSARLPVRLRSHSQIPTSNGRSRPASAATGKTIRPRVSSQLRCRRHPHPRDFAKHPAFFTWLKWCVNTLNKVG